eukprot:Hpha_TRINITY_DN22322_c0_g1::TRINITY_DN22322_c0_g1_i1::g.177893::m.177893
MDASSVTIAAPPAGDGEEGITMQRQETVLTHAIEQSPAVDDHSALEHPAEGENDAQPTPHGVLMCTAPQPQQEERPHKKRRSKQTGQTRESATITMTLSMAMARPMVCLTREEEEELRRSYLAVIARSTWRSELLNVAQTIVITTPMDMCSEVPEPETEWSVGVKYQGKVRTFSKSRIVTVGRYPDNDVQLNETSLGCSRLHCVVFALPEKRRLLIADVGSCVGVQVTERSGPEGLLSSVPRKRKPILLQWGETAVLRLADETVVINPKECVVCMTEAREVRFACGHFVCCGGCSRALYGNCPICRQQGGVVATDGARTMAVPSQAGNVVEGQSTVETPVSQSDPKGWDTEGVLRWLRNDVKAEEETCGAFQSNHIRGDVLLSLTEADLSALGVASFGDRRRIAQQLDILRQESITHMRSRSATNPPAPFPPALSSQNG